MAENEITTEIRKKVQAAVEAVAKEKFNESSHIDRVDLQTFLDAISVTRIEPVAPSCVLGGQQLVETNRTEREYLFPGNPSANASAHLNLAQQPLTGTVEGSVHFTANEQLDEQPRRIPPNAQRKHKQNISTHIYKLYLTVQADCLVRVYGSKPLVIGASAVGTATGIAGGAVAGTATGIAGGITLAGSLAPVAGGSVLAFASTSGIAGGITGGALIGSVVPVAGAIVGGIVGAIVGGLVMGRGAAVGTGVRVGAVDSKRTYKMIQAREVFKKLQNFSVDKANACHCTIVANTFSSLDHRILYAND